MASTCLSHVFLFAKASLSYPVQILWSWGMSSPKAVKRRKGDLREAKKEVFLEGRVFVRYFSSNVQRQVRYLVKLVQGMGSERLYSYPHSAPSEPKSTLLLCWEPEVSGETLWQGTFCFLHGGFLAHTSPDPKDTPRLKMTSLECFQIENLRLSLTSCALCLQLNSNFTRLRFIYL